MDTCSFLDGWGNRFFPAKLPQFQLRIGGLIAEGRLKIPDEVRAELEHQTDAYQWVKTQVGFVVPLDGAQEAMVRHILQDFSGLVDIVTNRSRADPFLIALAKCRGFTVVTEERRGSSDHPRIPYVCEELHVNCIKLDDLISLEGWL